MNAINPFEALVLLATLDKKLIDSQRSIDLLTKKSEEIEATLNTHARDLQEKEKALNHIKKELNTAETELKSVLNSLIKKKNQLDISSSSKEYQSLYQDISDLEPKKNVLEERVLSLMDSNEETQAAYAAALVIYEKNTVSIAQEKQKVLDEIASLQNQIVTFSKEAPDLYQQLNPMVLASYLKMKENAANPAVEVIEARCTGCYYPVSSQDLAELRKHKILACKDCYRLLYMR
jgi:predicted  nucleic acid-binding Zn-ribbon protein